MKKNSKLVKIMADVNAFYKGRTPFYIWFVGYFVGLKKELVRTKWLKGKGFGSLILKVFFIIGILAGTLFLINYTIVVVFGQIGIF